jgi:hypothetical protein
MGYRSTVAYTIRFRDDRLFNLFLAEAKVQGETKLCFSDEEMESEHLKIIPELRHINFFADDVKWYSEYPDVQCHENLLNLAKEYIAQHSVTETHDNCDGRGTYDKTYEPCGWVFIRIGEEATDIVEECGGDYDWSWINLCRSIEVDWK